MALQNESSVSSGRSIMLETLSPEDFRRLSRLVRDHCGIQITDVKKTLLEGRIRKRMLLLNIANYRDYCRYLFSSAGYAEELTPFIDAVTTNKTDFFRESWHFEFLQQEAIPELHKLYGAGESRPLRVWSAACSTGEEPYTLAMVISEMASRFSSYKFSILATDISTRVLEIGQAAIYDSDRVESVPAAIKKKYLMRSKDARKALVRIVPELRRLVRFQRLNLMDAQYEIPEPMDVIFCRNVIIYFDRATQAAIIHKLCRHLIPGGYLFMGHSEALTNMQIPVVSVATSVYQKPLEG